MLWAPGAGQSLPLVCLHPVTQGVTLGLAVDTSSQCRRFFPAALSRAGTPLAPGRARLALLHSWEKEVCVYFPGRETRSPHSSLHGPSWSLTPNWAFLPLALGFGALGT